MGQLAEIATSCCSARPALRAPHVMDLFSGMQVAHLHRRGLDDPALKPFRYGGCHEDDEGPSMSRREGRMTGLHAEFGTAALCAAWNYPRLLRVPRPRHSGFWILSSERLDPELPTYSSRSRVLSCCLARLCKKPSGPRTIHEAP